MFQITFVGVKTTQWASTPDLLSLLHAAEKASKGVHKGDYFCIETLNEDIRTFYNPEGMLIPQQEFPCHCLEVF